MNPLTAWLVDNAIEVALIVIGGVYAVSEFRSGVKKMADKLTKIEECLDAHLGADYPHSICKLEQQKVNQILTSIEHMANRFEVLDDRIVRLIEHK